MKNNKYPENFHKLFLKPTKEKSRYKPVNSRNKTCKKFCKKFFFQREKELKWNLLKEIK